MTNDNKLKTRISALIAKAQGTDNEHEAAAFMAKAEAMMEEYQLTILDLDNDDPMGIWEAYWATPSAPTWKNKVLGRVAAYYGCKLVKKGTSQKFVFQVVGSESARITVEAMYPFIIDQCNAEGRKIAPETGLSPAAAARRVGNALVFRIQDIIVERQKQDRGPDPIAAKLASNALVRVDALKAFLEKQYGQLGKGRSRGISTNDAARAAAGRVSLNRQMGGGTQKAIGSR